MWKGEFAGKYVYNMTPFTHIHTHTLRLHLPGSLTLQCVHGVELKVCWKEMSQYLPFSLPSAPLLTDDCPIIPCPEELSFQGKSTRGVLWHIYPHVYLSLISRFPQHVFSILILPETYSLYFQIFFLLFPSPIILCQGGWMIELTLIQLTTD